MKISRRLGEPLAPNEVDVDLEVHPRNDYDHVLKIHGQAAVASLRLWRCPTCYALVLPDDFDRHEDWHTEATR